MKKLLALLLFFTLLALVAGQGALAQVIRPSATPRTVAAARPTITVRYPTPTPAATATPPPGMVLWLEADANVFSDQSGTVVAVDTDSVRFWGDQSVNSYDLVSLTGASGWPKYRTNQLNSNPVIYFDSLAGTYLRATGLTDVIASGQVAMTMLFVVGPQQDGTAMNTGAVVSQDEGGGPNDKWIVSNGGITNSFALHTHDGVTGENMGLNGTEKVTTGWKMYSWRRATTGHVDTWNANTVDLTNAGPFTTNFDVNTGSLDVGNAETIFPLLGGVALILVYESELNDADMTTLRTYAANKYGF